MTRVQNVVMLPAYDRLKEDLSKISRAVVVKGHPRSGKSSAITVLFPKARRISAVSRTGVTEYDDGHSFLHISLPIEFSSNAELEDWKSFVTDLAEKYRNKVIIEGREYVVNSVLGDQERIEPSDDLRTWKRIIQRISKTIELIDPRRHLRHETFAVNQATYHVRDFRLREEDAKELLRSKGVTNESQQKRILQYAHVNIKAAGEIYLPELITSAVDNQLVLNRDTLAKIERAETRFAAKISFEFAAAEGVAETFKAQIGQTVAILSASLGSLASTTLGIGALFIAFFGFAKMFEKDFKLETVESAELWQSLPQAKREIIASGYDKALNLLPGASKKILDNLFLDIEELKKEVNEIWGILQDVQCRQGIYTTPEPLGVGKNQNGYTLEKDLRLVIGPKLSACVEEARASLKRGERIAIVGHHGIGKSVVARYTLSSMFEHGEIDRVIDLSNYIGDVKNEIDGIKAAEIVRTIVLVDPSSPGLYAFDMESGEGTAYSKLEEDFGPKIADLLHTTFPAIIVLPTLLYARVKRRIEGVRLLQNTTEIDLKDEETIKGIIATRLTEPLKSEGLQSFAQKIMLLKGGYALIASCLGGWMERSRRTGSVTRNADIEFALDASIRNRTNGPVTFMKYYIFHVIVRNRELQFALPILVHAFFGDASRELVEMLPCLTGGQLLVDDFAVSFFAEKQEDLLEFAIGELVQDSIKGRNPAGLENLINALRITLQTLKIATDETEAEIKVKLLSEIQRFVLEQLGLLDEKCTDYLLHLDVSALLDIPIGRLVTIKPESYDSMDPYEFLGKLSWERGSEQCALLSNYFLLYGVLPSTSVKILLGGSPEPGKDYDRWPRNASNFLERYVSQHSGESIVIDFCERFSKKMIQQRAREDGQEGGPADSLVDTTLLDLFEYALMALSSDLTPECVGRVVAVTEDMRKYRHDPWLDLEADPMERVGLRIGRMYYRFRQETQSEILSIIGQYPPQIEED